MPERYGRTQTVEHEHRVQFSKEGDAEAMKVLAKILGDDDVVDAEVVALEAEQPRQLQGDSEAEGDAALVGVDASVASTGQA